MTTTTPHSTFQKITGDTIRMLKHGFSTLPGAMLEALRITAVVPQRCVTYSPQGTGRYVTYQPNKLTTSRIIETLAICLMMTWVSTQAFGSIAPVVTTAAVDTWPASDLAGPTARLCLMLVLMPAWVYVVVKALFRLYRRLTSGPGHVEVQCPAELVDEMQRTHRNLAVVGATSELIARHPLSVGDERRSLVLDFQGVVSRVSGVHVAGEESRIVADARAELHRIDRQCRELSPLSGYTIGAVGSVEAAQRQ